MARASRARRKGDRAASKKSVGDAAPSDGKVTSPRALRRVTRGDSTPADAARNPNGTFAEGNRTSSQWRPGTSGNPGGRPRSRIAQAFAELMDSDDGVELLAKAKEAAAGGSERLLVFLLSPAVRNFDPNGTSGYVLGPCNDEEQGRLEQIRLANALTAGEVDAGTYALLAKALETILDAIKQRDDRKWGAQIEAALRILQGEAEEGDMAKALGDREGAELKNGNGKYTARS